MNCAVKSRLKSNPVQKRPSGCAVPLGVVGVVIYAIINSPSMGLVEKPLMNTTNAILIIMLSVATLTTVICKVDTDRILNSSTFKAGMSACICILVSAWLGDTFVSNNIDWIKDTAGEVIQGLTSLLAVIFFFASALLYSQAATAKALMPMALALNVSPLTAVASFAAVIWSVHSADLPDAGCCGTDG